MINFVSLLTILSFLLTMIFIFWRPKNVNEVVPATIGALIVVLIGSVSLENIIEISSKVSGAAITIISTIVMGNVLQSFGFFYWVATRLVHFAKRSGTRLFFLTNLLCFLMTIFFNNDGSILITTPILLLILKQLHFKNNEKIPYLISGALIATASSAPIGVSNIVNLISLKVIGISLYEQTMMMFVPGMFGILFLHLILYLYFKKRIPKKIMATPPTYEQFTSKKPNHPLRLDSSNETSSVKTVSMIGLLSFVFLIRISLFIASFIGIPIEFVAVSGSAILLLWRWIKLRENPSDMIKKTPWHILLFALSMYIIIYGLNNIGLTAALVHLVTPLVHHGIFEATIVMASLLTLLSNLFNNHPALMIGTLVLTNMGLDPNTVKIVYLANIIGSDIGSLLLPIGTLATLIWMHILRTEHVHIKWSTYLKATFTVIPPTVLLTLLCLYGWISFIL